MMSWTMLDDIMDATKLAWSMEMYDLPQGNRETFLVACLEKFPIYRDNLISNINKSKNNNI